MEIIEAGFILNTRNVGEADVIATLLTAKFGKIQAVFRGVKKEGAKLKAAANIFTFGEFTLARRDSGGGMAMVISANVFDNFFELAKDIDKFFIANLVSEVVQTVSMNEQVETDNALNRSIEQSKNELFLLTISTLNHIRSSMHNYFAITVKFLQEIFRILGFTQSFSKCAKCGKLMLCEDNDSQVFCEDNNSQVLCEDNKFHAYYLSNSGGVLCEKCVKKIMRYIDSRGGYYRNYVLPRPLKDTTLMDLCRIESTSLSEIEGLDLHECKKLILLLGAGLQFVLDEKIESLREFER